jgi:predicted RecA/RadA family phage recombinase
MSKSQVQDGRILDFLDSQLTKPSHSDGFTHTDDPVVLGRIVGVALNSAAASTDSVAVSLDGVFNQSVRSIHNGITPGETIYIDPSTCVLSDDSNDVPFGVLTGSTSVAGTNVAATVPVRLFGATPGATGADS